MNDGSDELQRSILEEIARVRDVLCGLRVPFALIGGAAMAFHAKARSTKDVDAYARELDERLEEIVRALIAAGIEPVYSDWKRSAPAKRVLHLKSRSGRGVDLLFTSFPFEDELIEKAIRVEHPTTGAFPLARRDDMVLLKLVARRPQDIVDVIDLLEFGEIEDPDRILRIVAEFAELAEDPEMLVQAEKLLAQSRP